SCRLHNGNSCVFVRLPAFVSDAGGHLQRSNDQPPLRRRAGVTIWPKGAISLLAEGQGMRYVMTLAAAVGMVAVVAVGWADEPRPGHVVALDVLVADVGT